MTFNEEEDEDTLVEEGPQIERGTVFHRDTCHREFHQRNIRDKRLPREACFDLGDVKVEKDIVTFNEEEDEDILVEEGPQIERGTVFHRDACETLPRRVYTWAMSKWRKRRMKTFSWERIQIDAARCFSGTRATVRFSKATVVTSGSRVKRVLTRAMSKWRKTS